MAAWGRLVDRIATRRLAGWAFVLLAVIAVPQIVTNALTRNAAVAAVLSIIGLALIAPAYLYLGRRLTPVGGAWALRLAALYVVVTAIDAAAVTVVVFMPDFGGIADAVDLINYVALVPFV